MLCSANNSSGRRWTSGPSSSVRVEISGGTAVGSVATGSADRESVTTTGVGAGAGVGEEVVVVGALPVAAGESDSVAELPHAIAMTPRTDAAAKTFLRRLQSAALSVIREIEGIMRVCVPRCLCEAKLEPGAV